MIKERRACWLTVFSPALRLLLGITLSGTRGRKHDYPRSSRDSSKSNPLASAVEETVPLFREIFWRRENISLNILAIAVLGREPEHAVVVALMKLLEEISHAGLGALHDDHA